MLDKNLALIISGKIRDDIDTILTNMLSLKNKLLVHISNVEIYFQTWNDTDEYILQKILINPHIYKPIITQQVLSISDDKMLKIHSPNVSLNVYNMFTGVYQAFTKLDKKYDYVCRCRNDLVIDLEDQNIVSIFQKLQEDSRYYCYPIHYWMHKDGCNDHFGIASYDTFKIIWGNHSPAYLNHIFKKWKTTPESVLLTHIVKNNFRRIEFLPRSIKLIRDKNYVIHNYTVNDMSHLKYAKNWVNYHITEFVNNIYTYKTINLNINTLNALLNYNILE